MRHSQLGLLHVVRGLTYLQTKSGMTMISAPPPNKPSLAFPSFSWKAFFFLLVTHARNATVREGKKLLMSSEGLPWEPVANESLGFPFYLDGALKSRQRRSNKFPSINVAMATPVAVAQRQPACYTHLQPDATPGLRGLTGQALSFRSRVLPWKARGFR